MKKFFLYILLVLAFSTGLVFGEEINLKTQRDVKLTFEQAYELMLNNNNALKAIYEEVQEKQYKKSSALGYFLPKAGINATYARLNGDIAIHTSTPLGNLQTPIQSENLFATTVGAYWNVFTGGKILALNSTARAALEATNEKYKLLKNDLTYELVKRYYGLRLAKDVAEVKKQVAEGLGKHFEDAQKLEKAGIISKSERLQAEVAYKQAQREYKSSLRDIEIVSQGLKALIKEDGVDVSEIRILPVSSLFTYKEEIVDEEEFKKCALGNNPFLKQLEMKKKIAKAKYQSEIANYSPDISLFAYDILGSKDLSGLVPRWTMGVSANMLLFDGFSRYNNVRAAKAFRKQVDFEALDASVNVETLVGKQYQEFMKYKEEYESADTSIESAQEALRTARIAFREGFATSLSVTDAQLALEGVKVTRLNAIYNYDLALADLLRTAGDTAKILDYMSNSEAQNLN